LLKLRDDNTCNSPIPLLSPAFLPRLSPNLARCKFIYAPLWRLIWSVLPVWIVLICYMNCDCSGIIGSPIVLFVYT
jgi:hypothetical protein